MPRTSRVLARGLDLPQGRYADDDRVIAFYEQLMERVAALPGVESVGAGSSLLLSRMPNSASINIEGRPPLPDDAQNIPVPYDTVTPGFFATLQIPLRRGRMLSTAESAPSLPVVLVNESFVRRFFPGEDPIGRRVTVGDPAQADTRWQTIVEQDLMVDGLFTRATWLRPLAGAGVDARIVPFEHSEVEPGTHELFVARRV